MDDRRVERLIEHADRQRRLADWDGAIDALRQALALDPDHAVAHAALALTLLGARRLHGAGIEARAALAIDGGDPFCHYAAAAVLSAERKLDQAWGHCLVALEADSADVEIHVLGATIRSLRGEIDEARELLERALELEASHAGALTAFARLELEAGHLDAAARRADEALIAEPDNLEAHVVAGLIALRRGDSADAESHARFALGQDANDQGALELWTSIKARRSLWLGAWWRFNAWVHLRSERGRIAVLIGSFVIANLAMIAAAALGLDQLERVLDLLWLGFCAYTWVGPAVFQWMLKRELEDVVLRDDY